MLFPCYERAKLNYLFYYLQENSGKLHHKSTKSHYSFANGQFARRAGSRVLQVVHTARAARFTDIPGDIAGNGGIEGQARIRDRIAPAY